MKCWWWMARTQLASLFHRTTLTLFNSKQFVWKSPYTFVPSRLTFFFPYCFCSCNDDDGGDGGGLLPREIFHASPSAWLWLPATAIAVFSTCTRSTGLWHRRFNCLCLDPLVTERVAEHFLDCNHILGRLCFVLVAEPRSPIQNGLHTPPEPLPSFLPSFPFLTFARRAESCDCFLGLCFFIGYWEEEKEDDDDILKDGNNRLWSTKTIRREHRLRLRHRHCRHSDRLWFFSAPLQTRVVVVIRLRVLLT